MSQVWVAAAPFGFHFLYEGALHLNSKPLFPFFDDRLLCDFHFIAIPGFEYLPSLVC